MEWSQLAVTTAIAVYGAILATLTLGLSLWLGLAELKRHASNVRVKPSQGVLIDGAQQSSEPLIIVEAVNVGHGSINITGVGWMLKGKRKLQIAMPYLLSLPASLEERRKLSFYVACRWFREIDERDKIVAAFFQDETGRHWTGRVPRKLREKWEKAKSTGWLIQWDPVLHIYYRQDTNGGSRIPLTR